MSQETTYHGILGELARLDAALDANAGELPHLEGARLRLASLVSGAEGMAQQQAALTASKQEASRQFLRFLIAGQRVATGIRRLLKEHYGINAEKLAEFGLQPFRGRSRRAAPDGQGTPVPPPEVQAPVPGNPE
jgi:hypothetical protein